MRLGPATELTARILTARLAHARHDLSRIILTLALSPQQEMMDEKYEEYEIRAESRVNMYLPEVDSPRPEKAAQSNLSALSYVRILDEDQG